MKRRGFLSLLGLGGAGLVVAKALPESTPVEVVTAPEVAPPEPPSKLPTMTWFMKEVGESFKRHLGDHKTTLRSRGVTDRLWLQVDLSRWRLAPFEESDVRQRYIEPIAETLAAQVKQRGLRYLAPMNKAFPGGGDTWHAYTSEEYGISLVCREHYEIEADMTIATVEVHGVPA